MKFFLLLALAALLSSCGVAYFPNTRNAPMFSRKGEFQSSMTTVFGNNLQAAYALTDHVGVMTNVMDTHNNVFGQHDYGEIGLGYYQNIKSNMKKGSFYADIFGGYGMGNVDATVDGGQSSYSIDRHFQGPYRKFFIQPGVAFKLDQLGAVRLYLGVVHRFSFVDISSLSAISVPNQGSPSPVTLTKTHLFFHEPAFVLKAVFKQFYLTCQGGVNIVFDKTDDYFLYNPIQLSIGAGVLLNLKREKN